VGTGQSLAHGASPGDAAITGVTTGGLSLGLGAVGDVASELKPGVKKLAGTTIPVRASQSSGIARAAEDVANPSSLEKFDVQQTQPAAKQAIGSIATDVRDTALANRPVSPVADLPASVHTKAGLQRIASGMEKELPVEAKPWGSVAKTGISPHDGDLLVQAKPGFDLPELHQWLQNQGFELSHNEWSAVDGKDMLGFKNKAGRTLELFFPPDTLAENDVHNLFEAPEVNRAGSYVPLPKSLPSAGSLREAAAGLKQEADPVFKKVDDLTKYDDMKFSDWQKQERSANRRGDFEQAAKAKAAQEKLISTYAGEFEPTDLQNARANLEPS
jgi:hypothetical protein